MTKFNEEMLGHNTATKQLFDERLDAHRNNPNEGSSWKDAKVRIKAQLLLF